MQHVSSCSEREVTTSDAIEEHNIYLASEQTQAGNESKGEARKEKGRGGAEGSKPLPIRAAQRA